VTAATLAAVAVVATPIVGLLVTSPGPHPVARPSASPSSSASASPAPVAAAPVVSPFTGERVKALGPVLAVKIDNIVYARPQTGLGAADIVYVIPVEGGLTRFMAIFSSHIPRVIGPVRSAREDDLQLLAQFGRAAFAWSGAQTHLVPRVETSRIVDLYANIARGYYRDNRRIAPYNLYASGPTLLAQSRGASIAKGIGFLFGPPPAGGQPTGRARVDYPSASYGFSWSASARRWLVSIDGRPGMTTDSGQLSAATVVIQHVRVGKSLFLEYGSAPPYAYTVGHGSAVVLRDGKAYQARWSRPYPKGGTIFTTTAGQAMTFAPGPVWVVLT